jgi:hypothetical protein
VSQTRPSPTCCAPPPQKRTAPELGQSAAKKQATPRA